MECSSILALFNDIDKRFFTAAMMTSFCEQIHCARWQRALARTLFKNKTLCSYLVYSLIAFGFCTVWSDIEAPVRGISRIILVPYLAFFDSTFLVLVHYCSLQIDENNYFRVRIKRNIITVILHFVSFSNSYLDFTSCLNKILTNSVSLDRY